MKKKLLIANRGEIAARIARTARKENIHTIGIARNKDKDDLYLEFMDEVYFFPSDEIKDTFLSIPEILKAAKETKADLLHPGYGFLSESAEFAGKVEESGIVFVGPRKETLENLGDKIKAKKLAQSLNVPIIPSVETKTSDLSKELKNALTSLRYPLIIKAGAGGGGRGMRKVFSESELPQALKNAEEEAKRAFGDGTLFIEQYLEGVRHIEVQLFGDGKGNVIHLFERDCSLQRKFQKIIEIAPATGIPEKTLKGMREASISLGKAAKLRNAATIEFLYEPTHDSFYFIECNPRLQVEHTITEEITGLDIVSLQLNIAQGEPLPLQESISCNAHSIQLRLCSEIPENSFLPSSGEVYHLGLLENEKNRDLPSSNLSKIALSDIRVDSGIRNGSIIGNDFDSLLLKIISTAESFEEAREKGINSLRALSLKGPETNCAYLIKILSLLKDGKIATTDFIEKNKDTLADSTYQQSIKKVGIALYKHLLEEHSKKPCINVFSKKIRPSSFPLSPLMEIIIPQYDFNERFVLTDESKEKKTFCIKERTGNQYIIELEGKEFNIHLLPEKAKERYNTGMSLEVFIEGYFVKISCAISDNTTEAVASIHQGEIRAPLPGTILSIAVKKDQKVKKGDLILSFDSMKTEHIISAPSIGIVTGIFVSLKERIERDQILVNISTE